MTLYLTSVTQVLNDLGQEYAELTDAVVEDQAMKAEAFVFKYTSIYPIMNASNAFNIQYTGSATTVTYAKSGATITITVDGTPTTYDVTAAANDTLAELVAVLDAVADFTVTITSSDLNSVSSSLLNDVAATDIKTAVYIAQYTPTTFATDEWTLAEMIAAATDLGASYCIAKILGIQPTGLDYKIGTTEISKANMARNLLKIAYFFKNMAKEHLDNISDGPVRVKDARTIRPASASSDVSMASYLT